MGKKKPAKKSKGKKRGVAYALAAVLLGAGAAEAATVTCTERAVGEFVCTQADAERPLYCTATFGNPKTIVHDAEVIAAAVRHCAHVQTLPSVVSGSCLIVLSPLNVPDFTGGRHRVLTQWYESGECSPVRLAAEE